MESKKAREIKKTTKKRNGIIKGKSDFFRSARYGLTLQEHRIIYYAVLDGQQRGTPFEPVTVSVSEFKELCGVSGEAYYSVIREISKHLNQKIVEIVYHDEKGMHLMQAPWLSAITYHAKEGTVSIELNKKIQPFFEGKPFTSTEFRFLLKFTSQYAERLYELLKAMAFKSIVDFDVADLRARLGIPLKKYPNYNMFRVRVLDPAIKDINEFTDIDVDLREKPRGLHNKVEGVFFSVIKKKPPKLPLRNPDRAAPEPPLSEEHQARFIGELVGLDEDELPGQLSLLGEGAPLE